MPRGNPRLCHVAISLQGKTFNYLIKSPYLLLGHMAPWLTHKCGRYNYRATVPGGRTLKVGVTARKTLKAASGPSGRYLRPLPPGYLQMRTLIPKAYQQ